MNREQRRAYNKKHGTHYTADEFRQMEILAVLRSGGLDMNSITPDQLPEGIHIDNEELVPEGTAVKLAYDHIKSRPNKMTTEFLTWLDTHKNDVMHVTRENANSSLVCVKEDEPSPSHVPWLFDIYSDFLYQHPVTQEWVYLYQIESK